MQERYIRNEQMLSREENLQLRNFRICVVGCGGLGGYIIEMLARLGIGHITAIDGDVFEASNMNRQLLSQPDNIGQPKAYAAKERVLTINPDICAVGLYEMVSAENVDALIQGHDAVVDALDNIESRRIIARAASALGLPMIHGAIAGWYAQVSTLFPEDNTLDIIYPDPVSKGIETALGNPAFTPALAASLQVAETVKVLLGKEGILRKKLLTIDTLNHIFHIVDL